MADGVLKKGVDSGALTIKSGYDWRTTRRITANTTRSKDYGVFWKIIGEANYWILLRKPWVWLGVWRTKGFIRW